MNVIALPFLFLPGGGVSGDFLTVAVATVKVEPFSIINDIAMHEEYIGSDVPGTWNSRPMLSSYCPSLDTIAELLRVDGISSIYGQCAGPPVIPKSYCIAICLQLTG